MQRKKKVKQQDSAAERTWTEDHSLKNISSVYPLGLPASWRMQVEKIDETISVTAVHWIVNVNSISWHAIWEWQDEEREIFGNRKFEIITNFRTTNMVAIILDLQKEEREFGQGKVWTQRQF